LNNKNHTTPSLLLLHSFYYYVYSFLLKGHPEFSPNLMKALLESRKGIIPDAVLEEVRLRSFLFNSLPLSPSPPRLDIIVQGLSKIKNPVDQEWLADLIVSFIQNGLKSVKKD
jgi:hypothetical protein